MVFELAGEAFGELDFVMGAVAIDGELIAAECGVGCGGVGAGGFCGGVGAVGRVVAVSAGEVEGADDVGDFDRGGGAGGDGAEDELVAVDASLDAGGGCFEVRLPL